MSGNCTIVICGCGTAGYWVTRLLVRTRVAAGRIRLVFCDRSPIREHNAITCPEYTTPGQPKCVRLATLASQWSITETVVESVQNCVEQFPWSRIISDGDSMTFAVVGLDNWPSRLAVSEDLREFCATESVPTLPMITIGLDRGQASIGCFGSAFHDPCPVCGLPFSPDAEPCVALNRDQELLRGNLHVEAQVAARWVRRIIKDCPKPDQADRWLNTKTSLVLTGDRRKRVDALTRSCRRASACLGPHERVTSIRWNELLEPITSCSS